MIRTISMVVFICACSTTNPEEVDGGVDPSDAGSDAGVVDAGFPDAGVVDAGPGPAFLATLDDVTDLDGLVGAAGSVKYLAAVEGATPRAPLLAGCAFQDTTAYPFHIEFLRSQPGGEDISFADYTRIVLQRPQRTWWGGEVLWRPTTPHPLTGSAGTLAFVLYTEDSPGNRMVIDDVRAVHIALTNCAPAFSGRLAFVPQSTEQRQTTLTILAELAAEGIAVLPN
jgi:hypothetical protein